MQFFYGEDTFSIEQETRALKKIFGSSGIVVLEIADHSDPSFKIQIQNALQNQDLFSARKMVILKNFLTNIKDIPAAEEYLLDFCKAPSDKVDVIFIQTEKFDKRLRFYKALQKYAKPREFTVPKGHALEQWVENYLKTAGFIIEGPALAEFTNLMAGASEEEDLYDLWQVSSELDKLMLLCTGEKTIRIADVRELVRPNISQNVFALTNLFAEGRSAEAQRLLDDLLGQGLPVEIKTQTIQMIGALASQIRSLLLVKDLEQETPAKIAATLGWKEGRVWINQKLAIKFSKEKLAGLMRDLRALDLRLKTSEEPPKLLLSLFLQKARTP